MKAVRLIDRVVVPHVATILLRQTAKRIRLTSSRPYRFHRFPVNTSSVSSPPSLPSSRHFPTPSAEAIVSNIFQTPSACENALPQVVQFRLDFVASLLGYSYADGHSADFCASSFIKLCHCSGTALSWKIAWSGHSGMHASQSFS